MPAVSYQPRYTVEDYLGWEGDWELWDGVPVSMAPSPDFYHQKTSTRLARIFGNQLVDSCDEECEPLSECDWYVTNDTIVRPDIMVICRRPEGRFVRNRPELAVEILSPSTRQKDLIAKRELYAINGVPFYLILDPDDKSATLLQRDADGTYREIPAESPFDLHPGCTLQLEIAPLFA